MSEQATDAEIAHNRTLIEAYTKSLRVLEVQAAKFGMFVPPYMQIEIDTVKADRQRCIDTIARLQGTFTEDPAPLSPDSATSLSPPARAIPALQRLRRPRVAAGVVAVIGVLALVLVAWRPLMALTSAGATPEPSPAAPIAPVTPGNYMVLVAQLRADADLGATEAVVRNLKQALEIDFPDSHLQIRTYAATITSAEEATRVAEQHQAAVIIWGTAGADTELTLQVGSLAPFPGNRLDRALLERTGNLNVTLTNVRQQSIAPYAMVLVQMLQMAAGNGFAMTSNATILRQIQVEVPLLTEQTLAARFHRGVYSYFRDPAAAIEEYNLAIDQNSNNPLLYIVRGVALLHQDKFDDAAQDAKTADNLVPGQEWATPIYFEGVSAFFSHQYTEAYERFDTVTQLRPNDWMAAYVRAFMLYLKQDYAGARAGLVTATQLQPAASFPYQTLIMLDLRDGKLAAARERIGLIQQTFPDPLAGRRVIDALFGNKLNPWSPTAEAFENLLIGRYGDALKKTAPILAMEPLFVDTYLLHGLAQCMGGEYAQAEATYTQGLAIDPDFTVLHLLRAETRFKQANPSGATEDIAVVEQSAAFAQTAMLIKLNPAALSCETFLTASP